MKTLSISQESGVRSRLPHVTREARSSLHVSRFTFHVSRFTPHAFTLIELLIVISIIAILAAMIFPVAGAINKTKIRSRARGELHQLQVAIDRYHAKFNNYPPDAVQPNWDPRTNQLFYELFGTVLINDPAFGGWVFKALDGSSVIKTNAVTAAFGPKVAGFVNCTLSKGDEAAVATPFLTGLKPNQVADIPAGAKILISSFPWAGVSPAYFPPFGYNSSNPTNNPNSYDLWVDVLVAGKTNRISNWSTQPLVVGSP
jgi:prepilin-type N-terminal cleavage/methylation domain-containing protein